MVRLLLSRGADAGARNAAGEAPRALASQRATRALLRGYAKPPLRALRERLEDVSPWAWARLATHAAAAGVLAAALLAGARRGRHAAAAGMGVGVAAVVAAAPLAVVEDAAGANAAGVTPQTDL